MTTEHIISRFAELGAEIDQNDVESRISVLTDQFNVPLADAENSVVSFFLRSTGIERSAYYSGSGGNQDVSIADIPQEADKWINLRAKVVDIWDNDSEYIQQIGIIADETGRTKFVLWRSAGLSDMTEGNVYSMENITTSEYNGRISVGFNRNSSIEEIGDDIEVGNTETEYYGVMVHIKNGSGLIKRCPECNRALQSGACSEHGNVEGTNDLRIMAVIDNGIDNQDVLFNCEMTESIWGHTLDEAISIAIDELDAGAVLDGMRNMLVGGYYKVSGNDMGDMMLANSFEVI